MHFLLIGMWLGSALILKCRKFKKNLNLCRNRCDYFRKRCKSRQFSGKNCSQFERDL